MEVLYIAEILTVLNSPQRFKKDTELQSQIPVNVRVSPIRSSSENRSSSSTTLAILQEVVERRQQVEYLGILQPRQMSRGIGAKSF